MSSKALDEMKEKEVLEKYEVHLTLEERKIVEAKFTIFPHPSFISEVKFANKRFYDHHPEESKKHIQNCLQNMRISLKIPPQNNK